MTNDRGLMSLFAPKIASVGFAIMAVVLPTIALFNNRAIVPFCAVLALIVAWAWQPGNIWAHIRSISLVTRYSLAGLVVWMATSIAWAPDPGRSLVTLGKLTATAVLALALIGPASRLFDRFARQILWTAFGATTALSLLLIGDVYSEGVFSLNVLGKGIHAPYGAFWFKPAATALAISAWPVSMFLWRQGHIALSVFSILLSLVMMQAIGVNTGMIATIVGLVSAIVFYQLRAWRTWVAIGLLSAAFLASPVILGPLLQPEKVTSELSLLSPAQNSIAYRLHIWHFTANTFLEKPLGGWGLGASRHLGDGQNVYDSVRGEIGEAIPLHPHNSVLQIFLELGVIGALLVLALIGRIILRLGRADWSPPDRVFAFGMFVTILLFYAVSFSAWSSWWNAFVCYAVALFCIARRSQIEVE